jgi:hypothetical protein
MQGLLTAALGALIVMLCLGALVCIVGVIMQFSVACGLLFLAFAGLTFSIYLANN